MVFRSSLLLAALLLLGACNRGAGPGGTTTTSTTRPAPTVAPTTTSAPVGEEEPEMTVFAGIPGYTIVSRTPGEGGAGDSVVVVLEERLEPYSERDLKNVVDDLIERFAPVRQAHVVATQRAAEAVLAESPTPEQQRELEEHYYARLEDGNRLVYLGPYAEHGEILIGS